MKSLISIFIKYLIRYWKSEATILVLILISSIGALAFPYILKIILDEVFPTKNFHLLLNLLILLFSINIFLIILSFITAYLYTWVSNHIMLDLRKDLFDHLIRLPLNYYNNNKDGDLVHRIHNEINVIQIAISNSLLRLINSSFIVVALTVMLCYLNWKLFVLSILVLPFLFFNVKFFQPKIRKTTLAIRQKNSEILGFFMERFENIKVVQSFNRHAFESAKLEKNISTLIRFNLLNTVYSSLTQNVSSFFTSLTPLIILGYGGHQIMTGVMTIGSLVAFLQYLSRIFDPLRDLMSLYIDMVRASVSMKRIVEIFEIPLPQAREKNAQFKPQKNIEFRDVTFSYDRVNVLSKMTFRLPLGKSYALVGPSGCGKSTILNLLCNFYQPLTGDITIDGISMNDIDLFQLRQKVALVSQDNQLFSESIWENIRYGDLDSTVENIKNAARLTDVEHLLDKDISKIHAAEKIASGKQKFLTKIRTFLSRLDQEMTSQANQNNDASIGDRGTKLSGGQKQRIAIARAILKKAEILILDEATSALDSVSEKMILQNLKKVCKNKTIIIVSHRLSTIKEVDHIFCLNQGAIVEQGNHKNLVAKRGFYWNLYQDQLEKHHEMETN